MTAELLTSLRHQFDLDIPPMELLGSSRAIDGLTTLLPLRLGMTHDQGPATNGTPAGAADLPAQRSVAPGPPALPVPRA
jgi:hypothetical protein